MLDKSVRYSVGSHGLAIYHSLLSSIFNDPQDIFKELIKTLLCVYHVVPYVLMQNKKKKKSV